MLGHSEIRDDHHGPGDCGIGTDDFDIEKLRYNNIDHHDGRGRRRERTSGRCS